MHSGKGTHSRAARRLAALVAACALAVPATAQAGDRVTIGVVGDSVSEGYTTPNALTRSFVPNLADALVRRGLARGGVGFVPAMPFRWKFTRPVAANAAQVPAGGWRLLGFGNDVQGTDGPSTYSAAATSSAARASASLRGPHVRLLFTSTPTSTPFVVTAGSRTWKLDAFAFGEERPVGFSLTLPKGIHTVTVHGPQRGALNFVGAMDRRTPPAGHVQVEVDNLAHAGLMPQDSLAPRVIDSLEALDPDVTLFVWGYAAELIIDGTPAPADLGDRYAYGLLARARLARLHGGRCVIADTTPIPVARSIAERFSAINRRVAAEAGCTHTAVLAKLWSDPQTAFERGLTQVDDVHPTPNSYRRMSEALAPLLRRLALERLEERRAAAQLRRSTQRAR